MNPTITRIVALLFLFASMPGCAVAWLLADADDGPSSTGASSSSASSTGGATCEPGEKLKCSCEDTIGEAACVDGAWGPCPCPAAPDAGPDATAADAGPDAAPVDAGTDAGPCVPKTCSEVNAQGSCFDLGDGCGGELDCSGSCGDPNYITCVGNGCTCTLLPAMGASCVGTIGSDYPNAVRCSESGGPVPGVPSDCLPLGTGEQGPSPFWCCGTIW